jgi:hypothetical protein
MENTYKSSKQVCTIVDLGIQSIWIILTVIIPGLVFYGTLRVLMAIFGISFPFLATIDSSELLTLCILFAIMLTLQVFGITIETIAYEIGPYKHKNPEYQAAFEKKYEIIATIDPEKRSETVRILSQFFMSHNIAIGMTINLSWVIIYEFLVLHRFDPLTILVTALLLVITIYAIYIPYNRFNQACKALNAHIKSPRLES